jgi:hypothetical protein
MSYAAGFKAASPEEASGVFGLRQRRWRRSESDLDNNDRNL